MNDRIIFGTIVRRNTKGISTYSDNDEAGLFELCLIPTKTPMNVALDTMDKPTARKCVRNEQVKIPPSLPSSVSMGQGPISSSFVIPNDAVKMELK